MPLKFSMKFDHPFSHVFIFGNMFPESHGFVTVPVTNMSENGRTNFYVNWRIQTLKLLGLNLILSPNQSIYFNFVRFGGPL